MSVIEHNYRKHIGCSWLIITASILFVPPATARPASPAKSVSAGMSRPDPAVLPANLDVDAAYDRNDWFMRGLTKEIETAPGSVHEDKLVATIRQVVDTVNFDPYRVSNITHNKSRDMALLDLTRCIPYAEHGYRFKRPVILRFFRHWSWYSPSVTDPRRVEASLTALQKRNIAVIAAFERTHWYDAEPGVKPSAAFMKLARARQSANARLISHWTDASGNYDFTGPELMTLADVRKALNAGADPNAQSKDGKTALMAASQSGHLDIVKALLAAGAFVDLRRKDGMTALLWAALSGQTEAIKALLAGGADKNVQDDNGETALMCAIASGKPNAVKALIDAKVDLEAKQNTGLTALAFATSTGSLEILKMLLAAGADLEAPSKHGETILMDAAQGRSAEIVNALIAAGANKEARNSGGLTALMFAAGVGSPEVVSALLAAGADKEAKDTDGYTALMAASQAGRADVVKLLLDAGETLDAKDSSGHSALYWAEHAPSSVSADDKAATIAALREAGLSQ